MGISEATLYVRKKKYANMGAAELQQLQERIAVSSDWSKT